MNGREVAVQGSVALDTPQEATDTSVMTLLQMAVEKGDVGMMNELMDLQERVEKRDARRAFFDAVSAFQDQAPEIRKTKEAAIQTRSGSNYKYTYAPLEEITRAIRPALKRHGLSYSWTVDASEGALIITCVLRHIHGHEERSSFPVPIDAGAKMSDAQKNGAALTYGKRQSLTSVLGLTTADADTDGAQYEEREPITDAQLADLSALLEEVGADRGKFCRWLGVESLADVAASDYTRAVDALEQKRGAR